MLMVLACLTVKTNIQFFPVIQRTWNGQTEIDFLFFFFAIQFALLLENTNVNVIF